MIHSGQTLNPRPIHVHATVLLVLALAVLPAQDPSGTGSIEMDAVEIRQDPGLASIQNERIRVSVDLSKGTYSLFDRRRNVPLLMDAAIRVNSFRSTAAGTTHSCQMEPLADALGMGRSLVLTSRLTDGPTLLLRISVYKDRGFVSLNAGLVNTMGAIIQANEINPLDGGTFFPGADLADIKTLDGWSGGPASAVERGGRARRCLNNQLVTFGKPGAIRSLVIGGLSYSEFERWTETECTPGGIRATIAARDPIGKRVDPGQTYLIAQDRSYIDAVTDNPFDALESYADRVRLAQSVVLPVCSFPIIDLWFTQVPHFGSGVRNPSDHTRYANNKAVDPAFRGGGLTEIPYPGRNDSTGAVEEMEIINRSGFLRYCGRIGILLEPDLYDPNNQQGWWDDAHWQRGPGNRAKNAPPWKSSNGQFVAPYETARKWVSSVKALGGVPMIYMQTGFRSQDYADQFPGHMIGNQPNVPQLDAKGQQVYRDSEKKQPRRLGYDYTDPGFATHVREVWENLRSVGLQGIKFDYPDFPFTGWPTAGGLEDPYATTAMHYRTIFRLAKEGLGAEAFVHERALERGSDVTIGLSTSQRTQGDTDLITPAMVSKVGLRWYKNRTILNYDMDGKNPFHVSPFNRDGMRSMLTMSYVVSGTLIVVPSVGRWTPELYHDLGRIYPFHAERKSARPVDAFINRYPTVYDYRVNPDWHQVTFYNTATKDRPVVAENLGQDVQIPAGGEMAVGVDLSGDTAAGALGLDAGAEYYVYDFWNDRLVGRLPGTRRLEQTLRPGEARMMSVRKVEDHPQFLSANRHVMQGLVDLLGCDWKASSKELQGVSVVVGGETYKAIVACNGRKPISVHVDDAVERSIASSVFPTPKGTSIASFRPIPDNGDLIEVALDRPDNGPVVWTVRFE